MANMPARKTARPYKLFWHFQEVRRGRCPHRPKGSFEFAEDFRKNGFYRRVDVGIDPYASQGN